MDRTAVFSLSFLVLASLASYSQGLSCYDCGHIHRGSYRGLKLDDSCKWSSKPDDKFLRDCSEFSDSLGKNNEFEYVCTVVRVNGTYRSPEDPSLEQFIGTIRGCGARLIQKSQQNGTTGESTVQSFSECKQGRLPVVKGDVTDATAKEYIETISAIFDDDKTTVKYCAGDVDSYWETNFSPGDEEDGDPEDGDDKTDKPPPNAATSVHLTIFLLIISSLLITFE